MSLIAPQLVPLEERGLRVRSGKSGSWSSPLEARAFTLIELLVVLAIIGIILAVSLPNFRGMGQGRIMEGATRQLLDDLALARQTAIATRSIVAVVFVPPDVVRDASFVASYKGQDLRIVRDLQGAAFAGYALFSFRQAGDQPGQSTPRYITTWKTLPEKIFIPQWKFDGSKETVPPFVRRFPEQKFPFPNSDSQRVELPYVAFNAQGQYVELDSSGIGRLALNPVFVPLASGAILYVRDNGGGIVSYTIQEIPPDISVTASNMIRIEPLTGRAKLERADVTRQ